MKLVGLKGIPIHYLLLIVALLAALALTLFAVMHGQDVQHFWHTVFISRHSPFTDANFISRH